MAVDGAVGIDEAASLLGLSVRSAQRLGATGDITFLARGLVDVTSIDAYLAGRRHSRARAWTEETAWTAIAMLSGHDVASVDRRDVSRLRKRLVASDAAALVSATRNRAQIRRLTGHPSAAARIRGDVITLDRARLGLVAIEQNSVDGYTDAIQAERIVNALVLRDDPRGRFVLRVTDHDLTTIRGLTETSTVLLALDAASSLDPRERGVGLRLLDEHLERFSG